MAGSEMLIVKKSYDFSKWLLRHTGKFPKSYRFSVAVRLENTILSFTELVAVANMRTSRVQLLRQSLTLMLRASLGIKSLP